MRKCFLLAFIVWGFFLNAQDSNPLRIEFSSLGRDGEYRVLLADQQGMIVVRNDGNSGDDQNLWRLFGYSVDMEQQWESRLELDEDLELRKMYYYQGLGNLLFEHSSSRESKMEDVSIDMADGSVSTTTFQMEGRHMVRDYIAIGEHSFILALKGKGLKSFFRNIFSSQKAKSRLKLLRIDRNTKSTRLLSDTIPGGMRPLRLNFYEHGNTVDVYMANAVSDTRDDLWMYAFSYNGSLKKKHHLKSVPGKTVVDLAVRSQGKTRYMTFSMSGLSQRYDRYEDYTDGIYFCIISNDKLVDSRFHKLSGFTSFFKEADTEMIRYFPKQKEVQGTVGYPMQIHSDLKGTEGEMILLAEAYYPDFYTQVYYDAYGMAHTRRIFRGYKYTHALAIAFDRKGEISWHEAMELKGKYTQNRKKSVDVISDGRDAGMVYNLENELSYQLISGGKAQGEPAVVSLPFKNRNDRLKSSKNGRIHYWYGNYLLATGYQEINNPAEGNRKLFYIHKIAFQ
ncbi:MAG: hypothetical protein R6U19_08990 [Bacteroidales bacterium]